MTQDETHHDHSSCVLQNESTYGETVMRRTVSESRQPVVFVYRKSFVSENSSTITTLIPKYDETFCISNTKQRLTRFSPNGVHDGSMHIITLDVVAMTFSWPIIGIFLPLVISNLI